MSELLGLRWGDIDFMNKKIMLNQAWVYGRIEGGKTEESREPVVLGDWTAEFCRIGTVRHPTPEKVIGSSSRTSCEGSALSADLSS